MLKQKKFRLTSFLCILLFTLIVRLGNTVVFAQQDTNLKSNAANSVANDITTSLAPLESNKKLAPTELVERTRQAVDLRIKWRLSEAESLWHEVLRYDNNNLEALISLAEIERTKLNYKQAMLYLKQASQIPPEMFFSPSQLLTAYGTLHLTLEDADKAQEYFLNARKYSSNYYGAILGQAGVALLKRDYLKAEELLQNLISSEPDRIEARVLLARVYLEQNRNQLAAQEAQKVLDVDKYNVEAMAALCAVRVAEKKPEAVRKLAKNILELNPYNSGVRRLLSQYLNSRKGAIRLSAEGQALITSADNLKEAGKYREAANLYQKVVLLDSKSVRALLGLGACELSLGNHLKTAKIAAETLELDPDNALAHLQLSLAYNGLHEKARIEVGATDWREYYQTPASSLPYLADVFVNYNRLSRTEQQVIEQAVLPFAHYLAELKHKGAKHYLLAVDKKLSDVIGYESLDNRITFDGRYYASVRGVGGLVTVSGIEYLDVAMRGGFNTIAHEFAHQVHTSVLSSEVNEQIRKLYQTAVKSGKVLDYYAASNEWEYFAQGYEAYVSDFKRPNVGVTARHTRKELLDLDPDLYNFLEELIGKKNNLKIAASN
ncbi:MAG: tetratricopeptide repeat protein [Blastocatellia bacterium]|nr:tetratricopeptide repeat protein [Blastocatellia bacterium]MBN8724355.1 tetratricopeptide repeat protein [Acidobacteriota bacterium]